MCLAEVPPDPQLHLRGEQQHHRVPRPDRHPGGVHVALPPGPGPVPVQPGLETGAGDPPGPHTQTSSTHQGHLILTLSTLMLQIRETSREVMLNIFSFSPVPQRARKCQKFRIPFIKFTLISYCIATAARRYTRGGVGSSQQQRKVFQPNL